MAMIPIESLVIAKNRRKINPDVVNELIESIRDNGMLHNIIVTKVPDDAAQQMPMHCLVAGHHRVLACKALGMTEIDAKIIDVSTSQQRVAELHENMIRAEITHLERAEWTAELKDIHEAMFPETRNNMAQGLGKMRSSSELNAVSALSSKPPESIEKPQSFVKEMVKKTGKSKRTIEATVRRGTHIIPEVKEAIRDVEAIANNSCELDALASMTVPEQKAAVESVLSGKTKSVRTPISTPTTKPIIQTVPFDGVDCMQKEGESWNIDTVKPVLKSPEEEARNAILSPPPPIDWKKVGKEYQDKYNISQNQLLLLKKELKTANKEIKDLKAAVKLANKECASLQNRIALMKGSDSVV